MREFKLEIPGNTKRFLDRYNPNQGGLSDKFKPRKVDSDAMKDYMNCFNKWDAAQKRLNNIEAYKLVPNYKPTSINLKNIQDFIYEIEDYYEELPFHAGIFPSYLFNELCPEKEISINIKKPWGHLGIYNSKILEIYGTCGRGFGYENKKEIVVNGNCGPWCGEDMKKGKIVINGNCGTVCGKGMARGEIHLNGDYEGIGKHSGGRIYHKGELICKDGVKVI